MLNSFPLDADSQHQGLGGGGSRLPQVPYPKLSYPTQNEIYLTFHKGNKQSDTNPVLFCVCFCFAVMPLTWDWPVCVFVHRIFIFIQFSLFENARSMMHLTDYFLKKENLHILYRKYQPLPFCLQDVLHTSKTLIHFSLVSTAVRLHDICAHLLSIEA